LQNDIQSKMEKLSSTEQIIRNMESSVNVKLNSNDESLNSLKISMNDLQNDIKSKMEQLSSTEQVIKQLEKSVDHKLDGSIMEMKQSMNDLQNDIKSKMEQLSSTEQVIRNMESSVNNKLNSNDESLNSLKISMNDLQNTFGLSLNKVNNKLNNHDNTFEKMKDKMDTMILMDGSIYGKLEELSQGQDEKIKNIELNQNETREFLESVLNENLSKPVQLMEERLNMVEIKHNEFKENLDELCEITQLNTEYMKSVHENMSEIISEEVDEVIEPIENTGDELWMTIKTYLEACYDNTISLNTELSSIGLDSISINEFIEFIYNQSNIKIKIEDIYDSKSIKDLINKYCCKNVNIENGYNITNKVQEINNKIETPVKMNEIETPVKMNEILFESQSSGLDTLAYYTKIDKNGSSLYIRSCTKNEILYHENMKNQFAIPIEILTLNVLLDPKHFGYAVAYVEKYFPVVRGKIVEQNGHYIEINMDRNNCIKVIFTEMRMHGNQDGMYSVVNNFFENNNNPFQNHNLILFIINNSIQKKSHLIMTYHHAFYDGVSLAKLQDVLLNSYCDSLRNDKYKKMKIQGLPLGIEHIIQSFDTSDAGLEDSESMMKVMQMALHPQSKSNHIPKLLSNDSMFGDTVNGIMSQHVQHISFTQESTKYARSLAQQYNISFYSYMCAIVMNTLSCIHDEDIHLMFWGITNARNVMNEKIDSGCHILFNMIDVNAEKNAQLWPLATKIHIQWATKTSNIERMCTRQKIMINMLDSMFSIIPNMSMWGDKHKLQIMIIYLGTIHNQTELQIKKKDVVIQFRNLKYPCLCFYFSLLDDVLHCSISGNIPFINLCKIASLMKEIGVNMC